MRFAGGSKLPESGVDAREVVNKKDASGTGTRPMVLFVLGAQRSGTSAITRVLSLCGGTLPTGMLGANADNPRGHWEPRKVIALNEAILHRHGSAWFDPSLRLLEDGAFYAEEKAACVAEITAYLNTLPTAPLVVVKDPRITTLFELWFEASRQAGFDIAVVIAVRDPVEVISSAAASWRITPELSSALWLKYNLLAERHTRAVPRVFVEYTNLLDDWHTEIKRISAALPIDFDATDEAAIDGFLAPELRRQRDCGPLTDRFGSDWISATYDALCAAARDARPDEEVLDRIFESYRAREHDFRSAFETYRKLSDGVRARILRPGVMKRVTELVALAHRRRGTWA